MWIENLPNGKFKYCERFENPVTGKLTKVSLTHTKNTKGIRENMVILLKEKFDKKMQNTTSSMSFKELSDKWFAVYKQSVKESTSKNIHYRLNIINRHIGHYSLNKLTPGIVNEYLLYCLTDLNNSYRTAVTNKSVILMVLKFGARYGHCDNAPFVLLVDVPQINLNKQDDLKYLERSEIKYLYAKLAEMKEFEVLRLCQIQIATGMRFNEMVALNYSTDIDLENNLIHITKNYDMSNQIFTTPKTGDARTININQETANVIREQINYDKHKMINYNLDRNNLLLFRTRKDTPTLLRTTNRKLQKVKIKDKKLTTHIFRHTFITLMIEGGADKDLIAKHVGHTNTKMIDRVYSHFTDKMGDKLKQLIDDFKVV